MNEIILKTEFPDIPLLKQGKVRDIDDLGEYLLLVATDRISAFAVILPNGIPGKGRVLTKISVFWFKQMEGIIQNHVIFTNVKDFPERLRAYGDILEGRSMLVKKTSPVPVECVVRGYLSGSGWKEYKNGGTVCSISVYSKAQEIAEKKGIIIADTKFEFGLYEGELMLIDELLTPDSSRFWSMKDYTPGKGQDSFDKQIVRD